MKRSSLSSFFAVGAMLGALDGTVGQRVLAPRPERDPKRDAERMAAAEGKRAKKAAKRARVAAQNAEAQA